MWFRILPKDDLFDDLTCALGVDWKYLLPVFVHLGLIGTKATSDIKEVFVQRQQWEELVKAVLKFVRLELSTIDRRGVSRVDYVCIGIPKYKKPMKQQDSGVEILFAEDYTSV